MKKSFPVNIGGRIFYFDEDAYTQLSQYYDNLRNAFPGTENAEIIDDIESRVAEILTETHTGDNPVVTLTDVNIIIERIGSPDQFNDKADTADTAQTPPPFDAQAYAAEQTCAAPARRRLYRDVDNKVIAGVLSGLSCYLGASVLAVRIAFVVLACFVEVWPMMGVYLVAWILIPAAITPRQKLEMKGQQVTVDNVGRQTILGTPAPAGTPGNEATLHTIFRFIGVCAMSFLGLVGLILGLSMLFTLIMSVVGMISYLLTGTQIVATGTTTPIYAATLLFVTSLAVLIPCVAACWATCCTLFKARGVSRRAGITIAIIELILIITAATMYACSDAGSIHFLRHW